MRSDECNHVSVLGKIRHQLDSIVIPAFHRLIVANVKRGIDDTKLRILLVVLRKELFDDGEVSDVPD